MARPADETRAAPFRVVGLFLAYACVHSLLASRPLKRAARRLLGRRAEEGLYRGFYNLQAVGTTSAGWIIFARLPDRTLYELRGPAALALHGVQLAGVGLILGMIHNVGLLRLSGIEQALAFIRGDDHFPPIEAQGPRLHADERNVQVTGPFRYIRHPENLGIILLISALPRMTVSSSRFSQSSTPCSALGTRTTASPAPTGHRSSSTAAAHPCCCRRFRNPYDRHRARSRPEPPHHHLP